MCSDIISYSFMFSRRKKSLSTILSVFVQIVPILFMLFGLSLPNDFYIICISNLFSTICTRLDIYIVFFLVFVCVQGYVILLFTLGFYWGSCFSIYSFMCMFCRSLFVILSFFFWPLCCLSFFKLRIQIISSGIFNLLLLVFGTSDCCQNVLFIFFRYFVIHHDCEDDKPFQSIKLSCVRENRWDNQEWTIQRYWQRCAHNTQDLGPYA